MLKTQLSGALQNFIDIRLLTPTYPVDYYSLMKDLEKSMWNAVAHDEENLDEAIERITDSE